MLVLDLTRKMSTSTFDPWVVSPKLATRKQPNPGCLRKAIGCLTKFFLKTPNLTRIECYRFKHLIYRLNSNFSLNCEPYRVNPVTVFRNFNIFRCLLEKRKASRD